MATQSNKIFLSANHDILDLLPLCVSEILTNTNYLVSMPSDNFNNRMSPPETVYKAIDQCDYFLLLLTPASLIYGFNSGQSWLWDEVQRARGRKKSIILLLAYGLNLEGVKKNWKLWQSPIEGDDYDVIDLQIDNIFSLADALSAITSYAHNQLGDKSSTINLDFLSAEMMIDKALVERYDAQLYNRPHQNREIINVCISAYPNYHRGYFERAHEYRLHRDKDTRLRVIADYDKAIELNPDSAKYYAARSSIHHDLGAWDHAMADISTAIKLEPKQSDYYSTRASYFSDYPDYFKQELDDYIRAIELNPSDPQLYERRSATFTELGKYNDALEDIDTAMSLNRSYAKPHYLSKRARIYLEMEEYENAKQEIERAISESKSLHGKVTIEMLRSKAYLYQQLKEYDVAIDVFTSILEREPDNFLRVFDHIALAKAHLLNHNHEEALKTYDKAISASSNPHELAFSYYSRGLAHLELKNWEHAIADFTHALNSHPNYDEALCQRAIVKQQLGDLDDALADIETAIEISPHNALYKNIRGKIISLKDSLHHS